MKDCSILRLPGMWLQALAHPLIALGPKFNVVATGVGGAVLLGLGTAMVYPSLLAAVGDVAHPMWRARSLSVYRSWRDLDMQGGLQWPEWSPALSA